MVPDTVLESDPFLLDAEQLRALASPAVVRRGVAYFKEQRVTDLYWDQRQVTARVEGTRPGGYQVELGLDEDGELAVDCDCPFEWEAACKHAVATLMAYGARQPAGSRQVEGAAGTAVDERVRRGRSEVSVKHVGGDPWMGTWEARSIHSTAPGHKPWRVELRSVGEKLNHCTCPDFATNRLGTCKHIEAVLHRLRKRAPKKFARLAAAGPPRSLVHLDWEAAEAPAIRLRRSEEGGPVWLDRHFDAAGLLRRRLPEAFEALRRSARRSSKLVIAEEVARHVERQVAERARRKRAAELAESIRAGGGELPGVAARLYAYQVEGVAHLAAAGRAMLADDMGLGKTVQAIAAAAILGRHEGVRRTLVICPASLKHQWAREVERFTGWEGVVIEGPPSARLALYRRRAAFTLVNYEVVLRDREVIQAELAPDLLILDEAQRIKNWRTKTAAAVKSIQTPFAFVLTGTPLENRLEDLYSLMQVVDPQVLGPLWRYFLDFHVTDERGRVLGYRNLAELRRRLAPVMLRRDKTLVRDQLPDRLVNRLDVELDRRQRELHDEAVAAAGSIASVMKKRPLTPGEERRLMAALQTARMACDAAGLVDGETEGSPKLKELATLLEQVCLDGGQKVVVFSQWERMTRMAEDVARFLGLATVRLHGGVPTTRRGALIDRFRDDPATQVFLSTDAGGVGLNLQAASVLINLDLPWNPAVLEQRIGRVHRLGQQEAVQVVLMVARSSYEERIAGLISSKQELFLSVVSEEAEADAVGVSKRLVDAALQSLGSGPEEPAGEASSRGRGGEEEGAELEAPAIGAPEGEEREPAPFETLDESLAPLVASLQESFGESLQRVVAVGGSLVAVVESLEPRRDEEARARAEACHAEVPVVLVDARGWAAMERPGAGQPLAGGAAHSDPAPSVDPAESLRTQARSKLAAAQVLAEHGHGGESLALATRAMILALAARLGLSEPPAAERSAVWLHAELVPEGRVDPQCSAKVGRALALSAAPEIPGDLLAEILGDASSVVSAVAT